jgi:Zn-dependent protease with chaperone function
MTPALKASARHWIAGTALAFAGVAVARLVAPGFEGRARAAIALTGQLVALGGLLVILLGIRRRLSRAAPEEAKS